MWIHFLAIWNIYVTDIWDIIWPFRTFCVYLVIFFSGLGIMYLKNLATLGPMLWF
jgi:hypothetical protein